MIGFLTRLYNNSSLYGHGLTSVPTKICSSIGTYPSLSYTKPDPGTSKRVRLIFEKFVSTKRFADGSSQIIFGTNVLPASYAEQAARYTLRYSLLFASCATVVPLGFAIKLIHVLGKELCRHIH